jgi:prevent-host-death family protein
MPITHPGTATTTHPDDTMTAAEARDNFSDLLNRVAFGQERILVTRHGKGLDALISLDDLEQLEALEEMVDRELLRQAREENEREGTVPWEVAKSELGLD